MVCTDGTIMEPVFTRESGTLGGWVCPKCAACEKSTGRERLFTEETYHPDLTRVVQIHRAA